ncbi:hypothetical protein BD779DRAFT_1439557, partial [Infundibulicybe gibba]
PQLIGDLPKAREEALSTFNEIVDNCYQYKTLGRSREMMESMTCDCVDSLDDACGPHSDCINRLTQVECLPEDCRCRSYCQNQRFQRKESANIEIVQTEKKGFGLRAECDIPKDSFIYEYVGDVVNQPSFKKRMRDYAAEGIRHFYFMMLQKDEFIDATKNGGIGRFANHSCSPNSYVAKWTIGNHVRMGIFAKRDILKHEELTFNYNVDRYGHQAQECYCGEPNCVGFIGGKTQTDIATMDDLYLDALGITDENDLIELKGTKKKKGKKIDDPDFMPQMKPLLEKDVPKVVQAIRQTQSRKVLYKLLTRIKITEDQSSLRQLMRLRGYSLMTNVLEDYATDIDLVSLALRCMSTWPLLNRNKVEDSKVSVPVRACTVLDSESVKELAQKLLDHWDTLPLYNRIPKRVKQVCDQVDGDTDDTSTLYNAIPETHDIHAPPLKRHKTHISDAPEFTLKPIALPTTFPLIPPDITALLAAQKPSEIDLAKSQQQSVQAIIAAAAAAEEAAAAEALAAALAAKQAAEAAASKDSVPRKKSRPKKSQTAEEKEVLKEKRLLKLVGAVVVKSMSKHSKSMSHDDFKKHAKELTQIIAEKEKKSSSYKEKRLESLSEEKVVKIKKFAKDYIAKVLRKLEKGGKLTRQTSSSSAAEATPSTSRDTPNSSAGADVAMAEISVEEAMDMDFDSESDEENDANGSADISVNGHAPTPDPEKDILADNAMDVENSSQLHRQPSDPRRRPPAEVLNGEVS